MIVSNATLATQVHSHSAVAHQVGWVISDLDPDLRSHRSIYVDRSTCFTTPVHDRGFCHSHPAHGCALNFPHTNGYLSEYQHSCRKHHLDLHRSRSQGHK